MRRERKRGWRWDDNANQAVGQEGRITVIHAVIVKDHRSSKAISSATTVVVAFQVVPGSCNEMDARRIERHTTRVGPGG
jgi:hypothetical protein